MELRIGMKMILLLALAALAAAQWSSDDMTMFDLVEEVKISFYEYFDVPKDASLGQIKKAYKRLALAHHPDKSDADDAGDKFRVVAAIYEILKDTEAREQYDNVLVNGLPDWRQPIFYYRNLRKMPWWESLLLLLGILSLGHYLMLWGGYIDRRLTATQAIEAQVKKEQKKAKRKDKVDLDEAVDEALEKASEYLRRPKPSQLLPILLAKGVLALCLGLPAAVKELYTAATYKEEVLPEEVPETDEERRVRRGVVYTEKVEYAMAKDIRPVSTMGEIEHKDEEDSIASTSGGPWSVEEAAMLIRLSTTKYPVGTANRWEKIAGQLRRRPPEVTEMIGKIKKMDKNEYEKLANFSSSGGGQNSASASEAASSHLPAPTAAVAEAEEWSQAQQRALETALSRFPKGTDDRWDRIAEAVPGKAKDECMVRFKHIATLLRSRKAAQ